MTNTPSKLLSSVALAKQFDAMDEIRRLARENHLAVSIITVSDVLSLKGLMHDGTDAQVEAVLDSYEWSHYGDNWADQFDSLDVPGTDE